MPDRFDRDFEIVAPGEYTGIANRFDRMLVADIGGLQNMLVAGCSLTGKWHEGYLALQLKSGSHIYANGKFLGIYPGLMGISECFAEGWDLVHATYNAPFEVNRVTPSLDDEEVPNPIDTFLKTTETGTVEVTYDLGACFNVILREKLSPKKERRGGRVLTYAQTAKRRGRSPDLFEALQLAVLTPVEVESSLVMDLSTK